ncbi:MAG TPA: hypothetical protein VIL04_14335 [Solirubrobacterales bacterium]|jgi:hypothetical protein
MATNSEPPTPEAAERRFRELLRENGIDQPDSVEHDPLANELVFLWEDAKLAVVLDLDDPELKPPV